MKIVLVSAEVAPFSKTGGMGDVCGALARALVGAGHRVVTVSPRYRSVDPRELADTGLRVRATAGRWGHDAGLRHLRRDGVDHVFVEHAVYDRGGIYGDHNGAFGDNHIRFALLSRAGLDVARRLPLDGAPLGEDVIFHANDWHTALVPVYLEALYREVGLYPRAASVLTLHNPAHQGRMAAERFPDLELPPRWFSPFGVEWFGDLGLLKAGVVHADQLTTVSPTFAREMTTAGGGFGLDGLLSARAADVTGILNGIDTDEWDPSTDRFLAAGYDADHLDGKAFCKAALQAELGLPMEADTPLVGSVGRLDPQKGVDLLLDSIPWLVDQGAQVVVLGSAAGAHKHYEHRLQELEHRFPHQVRAWIGFSEEIAHKIEAGADIFAMPSLFEPCGLNQLYSLRYGTVPVVRHTGGLADSVRDRDADPSTGTGYVFHHPHGHALRDALWRAMELYRTDRPAWTALQQRGMRKDVSWGPAVEAYEQVYRRALARRGPA